MDFFGTWLGMLLGFFVIQIVLCLKLKNKILKFIPLIIVALSYILAIIFFVGGVVGLFPEGGRFAGVFIMLFSSADLLGCLVGWGAYIIRNKIKAKKQ